MSNEEYNGVIHNSHDCVRGIYMEDGIYVENNGNCLQKNESINIDISDILSEIKKFQFVSLHLHWIFLLIIHSYHKWKSEINAMMDWGKW